MRNDTPFWPDRDPDTKADYGIDWSDDLSPDGDSIVSSTWVVTPGTATLGVSAFDGAVSTIWVSGGIANVTYTFTNSIVTTGGREFDRSIKQLVVER